MMIRIQESDLIVKNALASFLFVSRLLLASRIAVEFLAIGDNAAAIGDPRRVQRLVATHAGVGGAFTRDAPRHRLFARTARVSLVVGWVDPFPLLIHRGSDPIGVALARVLPRLIETQELPKSVHSLVRAAVDERFPC